MTLRFGRRILRIQAQWPWFSTWKHPPSTWVPPWWYPKSLGDNDP